MRWEVRIRPLFLVAGLFVLVAPSISSAEVASAQDVLTDDAVLRPLSDQALQKDFTSTLEPCKQFSNPAYIPKCETDLLERLFSDRREELGNELSSYDIEIQRLLASKYAASGRFLDAGKKYNDLWDYYTVVRGEADAEALINGYLSCVQYQNAEQYSLASICFLGLWTTTHNLSGNDRLLLLATEGRTSLARHLAPSHKRIQQALADHDQSVNTAYIMANEVMCGYVGMKNEASLLIDCLERFLQLRDRARDNSVFQADYWIMAKLALVQRYMDVHRFSDAKRLIAEVEYELRFELEFVSPQLYVGWQDAVSRLQSETGGLTQAARRLDDGAEMALTTTPVFDIGTCLRLLKLADMNMNAGNLEQARKNTASVSQCVDYWQEEYSLDLADPVPIFLDVYPHEREIYQLSAYLQYMQARLLEADGDIPAALKKLDEVPRANGGIRTATAIARARMETAQGNDGLSVLLKALVQLPHQSLEDPRTAGELYIALAGQFHGSGDKELETFFLKKALQTRAPNWTQDGDDILTSSLKIKDSGVSSFLFGSLLSQERFQEASYFLYISNRVEIPGSQNDEAIFRVPFLEMEHDLDGHFSEILNSSNHWANKRRAIVSLIDEFRTEAASTSLASIQTEADALTSSIERERTAEDRRPALLQIVATESALHFFLYRLSGGYAHIEKHVPGAEVAEQIRSLNAGIQLYGLTRSKSAPQEYQENLSYSQTLEILSELYKELFEPVRPYLEQSGEDLIELSLFGSIRYVPFATLYDADTGRFLTQDFLFTRKVWRQTNSETVLPSMRGVGFGTSAALEGFSELPAVQSELSGIFSGGSPGHGFISGQYHLDNDFTRATFFEALAGHPSILHIASHFDLRPDDVSNSTLLMGNGEMITLAEFSSATELDLSGVDLLFLSACSTGSSSTGTGVEIEGLGSIAQMRGARSVIATLWNVADQPTADFVLNFYKDLGSSDWNKAKAIQTAQEQLISNKATRHPYFWGPFVLMGEAD